MSEDLSLDSMINELRLFLKSKARNLPYPSRSLVFKLDNKSNLKIVDSDKKSFEVEEFFLESFRETFSDKEFKYVKISGWQFELELSERKCNRILLNADNVTFIANKNNKKQLRDIAFRTVVATQQTIDNFTNQEKGFIRRIIKKHIISQAENVNEQFYSLITFVKRAQDFKIERLTNVGDGEIVEEHPMDYLTPQGKKIIEKLRTFITRQDVFDFLVRQELSSSCENQLKNIVLTQAQQQHAAEGKKKKVKTE